MKQFCKRMTALLLAIMLAGVFPVLAESYTEYSGGLTVAGMRAADGNDTDLYVCIDGKWVDIGDAQAVTIAGLFSSYKAIPVGQLTAAYSAYGFEESTFGRYCRLFAVTSNGKAVPTIEYSYNHPNQTNLPVGPEGNAPYCVYYTKIWPDDAYTHSFDEITDINSFYTLTVDGLSADELAAVDYGEALSANGQHLVFTGGTATITVPSGLTWSYTGDYESVSTAEADGMITYTFTNVTGPVTLAADNADEVDVTLQMLDYDGNVISSQTVTIAVDGTLPADVVNGYDSQYKWFDEQGYLISSLSTKTFAADAVINTRPTVQMNHTANLYVHLDGAWTKLGQITQLYGMYNTDGGYRYLLPARYLEEFYGAYGFTAADYSATDRVFGYTGVGNTVMWSDTSPIMYYGEWALPLSGGISDYDIYYVPRNTEDMNQKKISDKVENNAFRTVTLTEAVSGATASRFLLEDTNLSQYLTSLGDTMLQGWSNPVSALEWHTDTNGTPLADTDTAETVQTLVGLTPYVTVTLQVFDYDGNVVSEEEVSVRAGSTLPAETLANYSTAYQWYNAAGTPIFSISIQTFTEDTVISTRPIVVTGAGARFFVFLDGRWQLAGESNELYGPVNGRYLVSVSQMEDALSEFGFEASSYNYQWDRRFAYVEQGGTKIWADTTSFVYYDEWVLPTGDHATIYDIYYLPHNTAYLNGPSVDDEALTSANSFHTVTLTEEQSGATYEVILDDTTSLTTYLAGLGDTILPGWLYPASEHTWVDADTDAAVADGDTPATVQNITAQVPRVKVNLTDAAGNVLGQYNALQGTKLADWLTRHDSEVLADGHTIHEYSWKLQNDTEIGTQVLTQEVTLVGTLKPVYTVTFVDQDPNGSEPGGSFTNDDAAYTSIQVIEGDTIPVEFINRMRANLVLEDDYAFVEWRYEGDKGYLVMNANTPIVKDTVVWADYSQEVYVRFWTSRDLTQRFTAEGKEDQPVGQLYIGVVPSDDAIAAAAPSEGMRFRYWMDANTGLVFTLDEDLVKQNLDLYPVYERAIFEFVNGEGEALTALHEGSALNYEAPVVEGNYYLGLRVTCNDGTTIIIPNDTLITREYLTANNVRYTGPVNGRYTIVAEPAYSQQRKVVYHTGDGAQFIIFGAENQESYTVTVDDELIMLGALDIINTDSPIGLALAGWTTTPGKTTADYAPNAVFEGSDELDTLVAAGGTVHLYPVWAQQTDTIAVTFHSNYPSDATDAEGNALTNKEYTVYIRKGTKPTMPTLARAGMTAPVNTYTDNNGNVQSKYALAGWSLTKSGNNTDSSEEGSQRYGTYIPGSEFFYELGIGDDDATEYDFYGIWVDEKPADTEPISVAFFIREDGKLPQEPSQHGSAGSGYSPSGDDTTRHSWKGKILSKINVVNNVPEVESNVLEEPPHATILEWMQNNDAYKALFPEIEQVTANDYGTKWWIDWYACKYTSCGHYHVDGRIRFASQVELNYHGNGGTDVPLGTIHDKNQYATVNTTQEPSRQNFIFIGWDEDPAARIPDYPANGMTFPDSPNLDEIFMDEDKDLYAIWRPTSITIPMDDDFKGQKYEQTNQGSATAPQEDRRYQFTIEAVTLPEGAEPYEKRTVTSKTDGSFTFPQINVKVAGMYVFEVREVVGNLPVQYDTSVYRLTINIVQSDYGLGIAGYSFTRNNKIIPVTDNNVDNVVFTFTNRTDVRNVTVRKVWDDGYDQDGIRPNAVNVTLLCEGDSLFEEKVTLNTTGGWEHTWEKLNIKDEDGNILVYYVVEDPVAGYTTDYSGDMNSELVVTNTHEPAKADFHVVKTWFDQNNVAGLRPETLAYTITGRNPQGVTVYTKSSGPVPDPWSYTFTDLPLYAGGDVVTYTLTEQTPEGYEATVNAYANATGDGGLTFAVTNRQTHTNASVTKLIEGNAANQADVFSFTAEVYDAAGRLVTDLPAGEGYTVNADGTLSFDLGHGETVNLTMLPVGGTLKVIEQDAANGYIASWLPEGEGADNTKTYTIANELAITVTNTRAVEIQTGLVVETEPYLLLLSLALISLLGWQYRRRRV